MTASTLPPHTAPITATFSPLDKSGRISLCTDACLARKPVRDCTACATACPATILHIDAMGSLALVGECSGCGRCAAACPTGALRAEGFAFDVSHRNAPARLDCARVPARHRAQGARAIPCLGGISVTDLLQWTLDAAPQALVLLDRAGCGNCPDGGDGTHPAAAALERANEILAAFGWPTEQRPHLTREPLRHAALSAPPSQAPVNPARRAFFGRIVAPLESAATSAAPSPRQARKPVALPGRERLRRVIGRLEAHSGQRAPAWIFPQIEISAGCANDQVCAAVCPTGALAGYARDTVGIEFAAVQCVACGLCARFCPEHAVSLVVVPCLPAAAQSAKRTVTRFAERRCGQCGTSFAVIDANDRDATATLCPECRKQSALVASIFPHPSLYRGSTGSSSLKEA